MDKNKGSMGIGKKCSTHEEPHSAPPTYEEVGVTKKEAATAQQLASLPAEEKEKVAAIKRPTTEEGRCEPPTPTNEVGVTPATYKEVGITYKEAATAQQLAFERKNTRR